MKTIKTPRGEQGYVVLMLVLVFVAASLATISTALLSSESGLRRARISRDRSQTVHAADTGLQHGLEIVKDKDFNTLLCSLPPCPLIPLTSFPPGSTSTSYLVTVSNDDADGGGATTDTNNTIILNTTAYGPNGSQRTVQAYVKRSSSGFTPPGAIYIYGTSFKATHQHDSFLLTGNDTKSDGSAGPQPAIHGVSATSTTVRDAFLNSLGSDKLDNVQGKDYSAGTPIQPSLAITSELIDPGALAAKFKAKIPVGSPCPPLCLNGYAPNKAVTLGTVESPQITYIEEGSGTAHFDKSGITGVGVLVTVGRTRIYNDFIFRGLIVTVAKADAGNRDQDYTFVQGGTSRIYGSAIFGPQTGTNWIFGLWTRDAPKLYYSSEDLARAYALCPECFPLPLAKLLAWHGR